MPKRRSRSRASSRKGKHASVAFLLIIVGAFSLILSFGMALGVVPQSGISSPPTLQISPSVALINQYVQISASGFTPNKLLTLQFTDSNNNAWGGGNGFAQFTIQSDGTIFTQFIPAVPDPTCPSPCQVRVLGTDNGNPPLSAQATFSVVNQQSIQVRVSDSCGYPIVGVPVFLSGLSTQTQTTDSNGYATFPNVPGGTYTISLDPTGTQGTFRPYSQTITVGGGNLVFPVTLQGTDSHCTLYFTSTAVLNGQTIYTTTGIVDPDLYVQVFDHAQNPLSQVIVLIQANQNGGPSYTAATNCQGIAHFSNPLVGTYSVSVLIGGTTVYFNNGIPVNVGSYSSSSSGQYIINLPNTYTNLVCSSVGSGGVNQDPVAITVACGSTTLISGSVALLLLPLQSNSPANQIIGQISLVNPNIVPSGYAALIQNVPIGSYEVFVDQADTSQSINVVSQSVPSVNLQYEPFTIQFCANAGTTQVTTTGITTAASTTPNVYFAMLTVVVNSASRGTLSGIQVTITGSGPQISGVTSNGMFTANVAPGTYIISVHDPSGNYQDPSGSITMNLNAGQQGTATFTLNIVSSVTLTSTATGQGLGPVIITLVDCNSQIITSGIVMIQSTSNQYSAPISGNSATIPSVLAQIYSVYYNGNFVGPITIAASNGQQLFNLAFCLSGPTVSFSPITSRSSQIVASSGSPSTVIASTTFMFNTGQSPVAIPFTVTLSSSCDSSLIVGGQVSVNGKVYFTGPSGSAQFILATGSYTITASASGFQPLTQSVLIQSSGGGTTFNLKCNNQASSINPSQSNPNPLLVSANFFVNVQALGGCTPSTASIAGPIVGASVSMNGISQLTDQNGQAQFKLQNGGYYNLTASASEFQTRSQGVFVDGFGSANVILTCGNANSITTSSTLGTQTITNIVQVTVTDAYSGTPIIGAIVSFAGTNYYTGPNGQATITVPIVYVNGVAETYVPIGNSTTSFITQFSSNIPVIVTANGYQTYSNYISVTASSTSLNIPLLPILRCPCRIRTIISDSQSGIGIQSATVNLAQYTNTTDATGQAFITIPNGPPPTNFPITVSASGYQPWGTQIQVATPFSSFQISLVKPQTPYVPSVPNCSCTISIQVLNIVNGQPIQGAIVTLDSSTLPQSTNLFGVTSFSNVPVPPANHNVQASASGYGTTIVGIVVTTGTQYTILLAPNTTPLSLPCIIGCSSNGSGLNSGNNNVGGIVNGIGIVPIGIAALGIILLVFGFMLLVI